MRAQYGKPDPQTHAGVHCCAMGAWAGLGPPVGLASWDCEVDNMGIFQGRSDHSYIP